MKCEFRCLARMFLQSDDYTVTRFSAFETCRYHIAVRDVEKWWTNRHYHERCGGTRIEARRDRCRTAVRRTLFLRAEKEISLSVVCSRRR